MMPHSSCLFTMSITECYLLPYPVTQVSSNLGRSSAPRHPILVAHHQNPCCIPFILHRCLSPSISTTTSLDQISSITCHPPRPLNHLPIALRFPYSMHFAAEVMFAKYIANLNFYVENPSADPYCLQQKSKCSNWLIRLGESCPSLQSLLSSLHSPPPTWPIHYKNNCAVFYSSYLLSYLEAKFESDSSTGTKQLFSET